MLQTPDEKMLLDVVDPTDRAVGLIPRRDVFTAHAGFRVAHVFVFNSSGELLLQQLASTRKRFAMHWGSSVAAYLFSGESYRDAAERRVIQEVNVPKPKLDFRLKTSMFDDGCEKFITLFELSHDGPFAVDPQHIQSIEFVAPAAVDSMMLKGHRPFTPTFVHIWKQYRAVRGIQP